MAFTAADVKKLREMTNVGMMKVSADNAGLNITLFGGTTVMMYSCSSSPNPQPTKMPKMDRRIGSR